MPRAAAFNAEDIVDAAMGQFWKRGYHATSMDMLVGAIGVIPSPNDADSLRGFPCA